MADEDEPEQNTPKIAIPRGPGRPAHAWDEQPPPKGPNSQNKPWGESRTVQDYTSYYTGKLYKNHPNPVCTVSVRSLKSKDPLTVQLEGDKEHTVADVKVAFRRALVISSRKMIKLRWLGEDLEDSKKLGECRVPDGALLEAAFKARTNAELEALHLVTHVLVSDQAGTVTTCAVTSKTTVGELKVMCKMVGKKKEDGTPIEVPFHFSPHYTSAFGTPLADVKTLGDLGVLDGDVLYMINPDVQPTAPVEAAPPPKKK